MIARAIAISLLAQRVSSNTFGVARDDEIAFGREGQVWSNNGHMLVDLDCRNFLLTLSLGRGRKSWSKKAVKKVFLNP